MEREPITLHVQVKDPEAPVEFTIAGKKVHSGEGRIEVVKGENGNYQLTIHQCSMADTGTLEARTPTNRPGQPDACSSFLDVKKGEEAPTMDDCGPVSGIAHKDCSWAVGFNVEGKQQSPLEVIVVKDGKVLKLGKHVNATIGSGGRIDLSVINPRRDKSGVYTVILKNAQGQVEKDINVNIMDKPDPPESCTVSDVFYDSCVVHWRPPKDDGGTEVKKYVVEALDVSSGTGQWSQVAVSESGNERSTKVTQGLIHKHRYRFRVRATNKLGQSEPCEMLGDDILIKDPWGKSLWWDLERSTRHLVAFQMSQALRESPALKTGALTGVTCPGRSLNSTVGRQSPTTR